MICVNNTIHSSTYSNPIRQPCSTLTQYPFGFIFFWALPAFQPYSTPTRRRFPSLWRTLLKHFYFLMESQQIISILFMIMSLLFFHCRTRSLEVNHIRSMVKTKGRRSMFLLAQLVFFPFFHSSIRASYSRLSIKKSPGQAHRPSQCFHPLPELSFQVLLACVRLTIKANH